MAHFTSVVISYYHTNEAKSSGLRPRAPIFLTHASGCMSAGFSSRLQSGFLSATHVSSPPGTSSSQSMLRWRMVGVQRSEQKYMMPLQVHWHFCSHSIGRKKSSGELYTPSTLMHARSRRKMEERTEDNNPVYRSSSSGSAQLSHLGP